MKCVILTTFYNVLTVIFELSVVYRLGRVSQEFWYEGKLVA